LIDAETERIRAEADMLRQAGMNEAEIRRRVGATAPAAPADAAPSESTAVMDLKAALARQDQILTTLLQVVLDLQTRIQRLEKSSEEPMP
jgi:hypothetical protein